MRKTQRNKKTEGKQRGGLFQVLGPYKALVTTLIIMALAGSGINLLIPRIIARGIDSFTANQFDAKTVITEFVLAAVGIFIFTLLQGVVQTLAAEKVAKDLRNKLSDKISKQNYSFILKANPSKLLTNMTSDMDSVKMFVSQAFVSIISSLFIIFGVAVLLISINWKLALAVLTIVPILSVAFYIVFKKVKVLFKLSREVIDALNRVINESILGSALIRVLNSQQPEILKFVEKNVESRDLGLSIVRLFSVLIPIVTFVANFAIVIILALGGHYVVLGTLTLGNFAAFNSYVMMLIFPVMMIGFMSNIIASATASYGRIRQVLDAPPPVDNGTVNTDISGDIKLQNISLSFDKKPVLKNISFDIKAGSKTAIIGPTAAGKSQLLYLLTNLISPDSGSITIDNIPVKDYSTEVLNRQLGFVFQDNVIFNMSLQENIAFNDQVSDEDLQKAIATAELADFIKTLPDGLNTIVSERGTSLSGGQKQRIMLARALALNPKILLLDDFTSRVDRKTEDKILANIHKYYPELTLLSITQKIAPVTGFDQIILLMEGEVVATGKHESLKENSPEYIQIYNSQKSTSHYETSM
ncbi:ABC transporter ATP-binding protein [uncultured Draconibacterium sp.]|uniref:ABC transporter ATP-binding protein n=1 Tax=uncultured Draconibacterium sp. TaxID=1573823 RepID=UPI00261359E4|nr:ABC transporter ATP-binding protein [uncultured Draconibacterium sp.]